MKVFPQSGQFTGLAAVPAADEDEDLLCLDGVVTVVVPDVGALKLDEAGESFLEEPDLWPLAFFLGFSRSPSGSSFSSSLVTIFRGLYFQKVKKITSYWL